MTETPMTKRTWLYRGKVVLQGDKPGISMQEVRDGELHMAPKFFALGKRNRGLAIGGLYTMQATDTTVNFGTLEFTGETWPDKEERIQWEMESRTADTSLQMIKLEKRVKDNPAFAQAMEPLRRIYRYTSQMERAVFEVMILRELRK